MEQQLSGHGASDTPTDEPASHGHRVLDRFFGGSAESAADARFVRRVSLVVVPVVLLICVLTILITQSGL